MSNHEFSTENLKLFGDPFSLNSKNDFSQENRSSASIARTTGYRNTGHISSSILSPHSKSISLNKLRLTSPSRLKTTPAIKQSPMRISRKPEAMASTPIRSYVETSRPLSIRSTTRSTMLNYNKIKEQTDDILTALNTSRGSTSIGTPSRTPHTLKRTLSTSSPTFSPVSGIGQSLPDSIIVKKRRKVTFQDPYPEMETKNATRRIKSTDFNSKTDKLPMFPPLQNTPSFLLNKSPEKTLLSDKENHDQMEILQILEAKFDAKFKLLQKQLNEQAKQIQILQKENKQLRESL